jgi:hypothetical protein
VAHPHGGGVFDIGKQVGGVVNKEVGLAVLTPLGPVYLAA